MKRGSTIAEEADNEEEETRSQRTSSSTGTCSSRARAARDALRRQELEDAQATLKEQEDLKEKVAALYDAKEDQLERELMRELEGFLMLNAIDTKWKDHLHAMDILREAVGLEGMAGKDPKIVYSQRGWEYFDMMIDGIKEEVTDLVLRMEYQQEDQSRLSDIWDISGYQHDALSGYSSTRGSMDAALAGDMSEAPPKPIRRKGEKIGRNDPCPCGSEKKYKKCCGAR